MEPPGRTGKAAGPTGRFAWCGIYWPPSPVVATDFTI